MTSESLHPFYSHVNYSVTKIDLPLGIDERQFYSHVNYSVTKIYAEDVRVSNRFYSHVNYSVTKIYADFFNYVIGFTVT